jgi:Ca2+-binding RTX toxin-like protein
MIERLENRRLLSVTTGFAGGALTVTGDADANNVSIVRGGTENSQLLVRSGDTVIRTVPYLEVNSITVNLLGGNDTLKTGENVVKPMTVSGGEGNDNLQTGGGNDTVHGNAGTDTLKGSAGNDSLFGDDNNDTMDGGSGADSFNGGGGFDTATYATRTTGVRVTLDNLANDGAPGILTPTAVAPEGDNVHTDVEHVIGGSGNDFMSAAPIVTATGTVTPGPVTFDGMGGNDSLTGSSASPPATTAAAAVAFSSILNGGDGNDELNGGSKADQLNGGGGNDTMRGNGGNDRLNGGAGADNMFGGEGVDTVTYADRTAGVNVSLDNVANDGTAASASVTGEADNAHSDIENIVGGKGNDHLIGSDAANTMSGGDGNDYVEGRGGADVMEGGGGNDEIHGGAGNDQIYGGPGADKLFGEGDNDFIHAKDGTADTVSGGDGSEDKAEVDAGLDVVSGIEILS